MGLDYNYVCSTYVELLWVSEEIERPRWNDFTLRAHVGDTAIVTSTGKTYIFTKSGWEQKT